MFRVLSAVALAALVIGCGEAVRASEPAVRSIETARTTLYFLAEDGSISLGVRRTIVNDTPPPEGARLRGALKALLAGPTDEERAQGLTTAIPSGTTFLSLTSTDHGASVVVDLHGLSTVDASLDEARVITQIVRTLSGLSGVERVWLLDDGNPWGRERMDGSVNNGPFDYTTLLGYWLGAACPETETVVCDSFKALP